MVTLTRKERITIIVTTHYIEEARQANVVGLMRQGRLLAENSPDQLMADYNLDTLEDVFLKLCMSDIAYKAAALSNFVQLPTDTKLSTIINGNAGGGGGGDNHNHYHHHHLANGIPEKIGNGNLVNGKSPSTITEKQFNHIETNGDLRNLIKVCRSNQTMEIRTITEFGFYDIPKSFHQYFQSISQTKRQAMILHHYRLYIPILILQSIWSKTMMFFSLRMNRNFRNYPTEPMVI